MESRFRLGRLLVSLMDAAPGHERSFHRWYERDHFHAGCMTGPGFFSGRRYLATHALRALRPSEPAPFLEDPGAGRFLALYFMAAGAEDAGEAWAVDRVNALRAAGRMHPQRRSIYAGFHDPVFAVHREDDGVAAELALDHPFGGVVLATFEAPDEAGDRLARDLASELRSAILGTPVALACGFAPRPLPEDAPAYVPRPPGLAGRRLVLAFVEGAPEDGLAPLRALAARASWLAAFQPTVPGTDRYLDEL